MKDMDSLTRLRLKTVGGYVSLMALFIIASVIVVCKSGNLEENSKRYSENIDRRALSRRSGASLICYITLKVYEVC